MGNKGTRFALLIFFFLPVALILLFAGGKTTNNLLYPLEYGDLIEKYSSENGLLPEFVCGVIYTESRFRKDAVSTADARGLMQITEDTFEWAAWRMGDEQSSYLDIFDPETNIRYGCYILRLLLDEFEYQDVALAAYNAGWGNVKNWLADSQYSENGVDLHTIPFKDTENYIPNVEKATQRYKALYYSEE